ncbi:MAG: hypothetical protein M1143_00530 [Candidatus Thermoplasmatota archaeon]|nr:hypothetical protein [Candidatus Thermoplasmatota archaeon]
METGKARYVLTGDSPGHFLPFFNKSDDQLTGDLDAGHEPTMPENPEEVLCIGRIPAELPLQTHVATVEDVPPYRMVPIKGPNGEVLEAYRGVQREDNNEVVSVVSSRYQIVQHLA